MNLKNTVDNTNKHINDLKLARNKINDRIISGGGSIANTISDVPNAIDRMLGSYKKIATGSVSVKKEIKNGEIKFPISLKFVPNIFIVKIKPDVLYGDIAYHLNSKDGQRRYIVDTNGDHVDFKVSFKDGYGIINVANSTYYNTYTITDWIAIE